MLIDIIVGSFLWCFGCIWDICGYFYRNLELVYSLLRFFCIGVLFNEVIFFNFVLVGKECKLNIFQWGGWEG